MFLYELYYYMLMDVQVEDSRLMNSILWVMLFVSMMMICCIVLREIE